MKIIALASAAVIAFVSPASASVEGARARAHELHADLVDAGWDVRRCFDSGSLRPGQSVTLRKTLSTGFTYKLAASGCEDSRDVDIKVYDENWNLIDQDTDCTNLAVADVTPAWTGTYYVVITMHDAVPSGAHYVLQTAYEAE